MSNDLTIINQGATLMDIRKDEARYPRLRQLSEDVTTDNLKQIVLTAYMLKGQRIDPENVAFIAMSLYRFLMRNTAGSAELTIPEIAMAVEKAVLEDDLVGINVANLYQAIMTYVTGEGKRLEEERRKQADMEEQRRRAEFGRELYRRMSNYQNTMLDNVSK